MMQKDEGELLNSWIQHHLKITDPEQIIILDNGSTCPHTLKILTKVRNLGVEVLYDHKTSDDFERKGEIIANIIRQRQNDAESDFLIPLDCDEFLAVQKTDDLEASFNREDFQKSLSELRKQTGYFKVRVHYFNDTETPDLYHVSYNPQKFFFGQSLLGTLDTGFHSPQLDDSCQENILNTSNIIAFHYHNKSFSIRRANAINKMRRRVCNFCPDELRQFHGPGMHLINDLRGIDSPFAPPKSLRTNAFLRHLSESKIPFPHDIFDQAVPPTSKDHRKLNKSQRQIVNQARISLLAEIESLQDDPNINSTAIRSIDLNAFRTGMEIEDHYGINEEFSKRISNLLEKLQPKGIRNRKKPLIYRIKNIKSLTNALLFAMTHGQPSEVIFDCQNFWENKNTQLLSLVSSAIYANDQSVFLRYDVKSETLICHRLLIHLMMRSGNHSGFRNKDK